MAERKTQKNDGDVRDFLEGVENDRRREDSLALLDLMIEVTGKEPKLWGTSIVGFGTYHYRYASGREGDSLVTGFSPRKAALVVYITPGFEHYQSLLDKLGKHSTGKSCLYINKLSDVDQSVLRELVTGSVKQMAKDYAIED